MKCRRSHSESTRHAKTCCWCAQRRRYIKGGVVSWQVLFTHFTKRTQWAFRTRYRCFDWGYQLPGQSVCHSVQTRALPHCHRELMPLPQTGTLDGHSLCRVSQRFLKKRYIIVLLQVYNWGDLTFRFANFFIVYHLVDCRLLVHRSVWSHKVDAVKDKLS